MKTGRAGAAAKAGHDLLIYVTSWAGTLAIGEEPSGTSVELTADATSLRVREGTGGIQSLGAGDKSKIQQTIDKDVLRRRDITFRSTRAQPAGDGLSVEGDLTLAGKTRAITFELFVTDVGLTGSAVIKQTDWGMKPYSTLFGALKVADEVEVSIDVRLPAR